jgi:hypothetical protein
MLENVTKQIKLVRIKEHKLAALSTQHSFLWKIIVVIFFCICFPVLSNAQSASPRVHLYTGETLRGSEYVLIDEVNSGVCNKLEGYFPAYYSSPFFKSMKFEPDGTIQVFGSGAGAGIGYVSCGGWFRDIVNSPQQDQRGGVAHYMHCENDDQLGYVDGEIRALPAYEGARAYCRCPALNLKWNGRACVIRNIAENIPPTLIGYFNGVANTRATALISRDRLQREYGATYKTKPLEYELFYNQTTCELGTFRVGKIPCLEDIAEVFEQRTSELNNGLKNRWEHFWEMLGGRTSQDGSLTATLTSKLGKFGEAILQLLDNIYTLVINQFVGSFFSFLNSLNGTPTLADNAAHVVKLKTYADKGSGMVLVAHSQGNLFVNAAYDGIKTVAPAAKVQVVHVAPASPTLRGGYALADVDFVIRSLRKLVTGLPSVNIELPLSANDRTGHAFEGTYLDITRNAYTRVKAMISAALDGV